MAGLSRAASRRMAILRWRGRWSSGSRSGSTRKDPRQWRTTRRASCPRSRASRRDRLGGRIPGGVALNWHHRSPLQRQRDDPRRRRLCRTRTERLPSVADRHGGGSRRGGCWWSLATTRRCQHIGSAARDCLIGVDGSRTTRQSSAVTDGPADQPSGPSVHRRMVRELFRTGRGILACVAGAAIVGIGLIRLDWRPVAFGAVVIGAFVGIAYLAALGTD